MVPDYPGGPKLITRALETPSSSRLWSGRVVWTWQRRSQDEEQPLGAAKDAWLTAGRSQTPDLQTRARNQILPQSLREGSSRAAPRPGCETRATLPATSTATRCICCFQPLNVEPFVMVAMEELQYL